jgi:hypothetical protein
MGTSTTTPDDVVDLSSADGVAFISASTPLTRLHYFDGQFLRADAFTLEQDYHRTAIRLANLAGGWGVVDGLGVSLDVKDGGLLDVGAGLGVTAAGSFVYAVGDLQAKLSDLLAAAAAAPAAGAGNADFGACAAAPKAGTVQTGGLGIYEITVGPVEGQCGNEAVFGQICQSACAGDSQRPYWREGVVLRLRPVTLQLPASSAVTLTTTHLRNRVASAYFAAEPWLAPSALSAAGLDSDLWCNPATLYNRDEIVIGLLVRDGTVTRVIDAWSGRRERMDTQARGYWQGRMAMRPWNVFVAQVLQFQCQLAGLFDGTGGAAGGDDCDRIRQLLDSTRSQIDALHKRYSDGALRILQKFGSKPSAQDAQNVIDEIKGSYADLYEISKDLAGANLGAGALPVNRMLLDAGFVELPPAGYLPVVPGKQPLADQLSRMFGEGVALTWHAVRHDEIGHLVEQAQHLDRISLTRGLDDPAQVEHVEIFVPDGSETRAAAQAAGTWWQMTLAATALKDVDFGLARASYTLVSAGDAKSKADREPAPAGGALAALLPKTAALHVRLDQAAAPAEESTPASRKRGAASARQTTATGTSQQVPPPSEIVVTRPLLPPYLGLLRTGAGDDGGFGFTFVASADTGDVVASRAFLAARQQAAGGIDDDALPVIYLAADISADPFDLAVGAQARITGELREADIVSTLSGALTVTGDRRLADGQAERLVHLDLTIANAGERITRQSGDLALRRDGDDAAGSYLIDDAAHAAATPPLEFSWRSGPRQATGFLLQLAKEIAIGRAAAPRQVANDPTTGAGTASGAESKAERLVRLDALSAMPSPADATGAAAMNALIRLGDATDDAAFVARARRRLFPALDSDPGVVVNALRDWVMFRRRRTPLCCPPAAAAAAGTAVDTIKVWHIRVADPAAYKALISVLDHADAAALAKFKFQQVGLLRYGDADTAPVETPDQVLAMWKAAGPAAQVVAGRYWENSPSTGQNWQNNFRLNAMLKQIAALTTPPPAGTGAVAPLVDLAPPLQDGAFDGGMLVVTTDAKTTNVVRNALLAATFDSKPGVEHDVGADTPRASMQFSNDAPVGNALSAYIGGINTGAWIIGVTLATTKAAPDAGANARMAAVVAALTAAGRLTPGSQFSQIVTAISAIDKRILQAAGVDPAAIDEVIYFELQSIVT